MSVNIQQLPELHEYSIHRCQALQRPDMSSPLGTGRVSAACRRPQLQVTHGFARLKTASQEVCQAFFPAGP